MANKGECPEWLSAVLATPHKASQEFIDEPRNALTPLQPYTPPHLDPISPAIVSRDYWKINPRQDTERDKRHAHHSSSRTDRHSRKRERSPEERHHRPSRSNKRHRHSSRHDRERRRRHRSTDYDDDEDNRSSRLQPYVDPALVPDPLAISGKPARISPRKHLSRKTSSALDIQGWVRSTSQDVENSRPIGPLTEVFPVAQRSQPVRHTQNTMNLMDSLDLSRSHQHKSQNAQSTSRLATGLLQQQLYPVEPVLSIKQPRPFSQNPHDTRPFTPQTVQPITPILQPKPTRPIPISHLTHASQPANVIPIRKALDQRGPARQNSLMNHDNTTQFREHSVPFHFQPAALHPRDALRDANAASHSNQGPRAFMPMEQAIRKARAAQQAAPRVPAEPMDPTSPQYDAATDSGYGQPLAQSFHNRLYADYPQRTSTPAPGIDSAAPQASFTIYCGTGTQEPPQTNTNAQGSASVWNPNLANCTATKPRRLTLKQDNDFIDADRRHRAEDMRNSISVVKNSMEARYKPHSDESQHYGPVSTSQQDRRSGPMALHRYPDN